MANTIALFKQYTALLDEVYKQSALTSKIDGASDLATQGANANELIIPMLTMDGLADYSRNSGYVDGDVELTNETVKCNFDRGRMFTVDTMDNAETAGIAFGRLSGEFIRTKVVPELDAFRFAKYAGTSGISSVSATLTTGEDVVKALRTASTKWTRTKFLSRTDTFSSHHRFTVLCRILIQQSQGRFSAVLQIPHLFLSQDSIQQLNSLTAHPQARKRAVTKRRLRARISTL